MKIPQGSSLLYELMFKIVLHNHLKPKKSEFNLITQKDNIELLLSLAKSKFSALCQRDKT